MVKNNKTAYYLTTAFLAVTVGIVGVLSLESKNEDSKEEVAITEKEQREAQIETLNVLREISFSVTANGFQDFAAITDNFEVAYKDAPKDLKYEYGYYLHQSLLSYSSFANYILLRGDTISEIGNFEGSLFDREDLLAHQEKKSDSFVSQIALTLKENYLTLNEKDGKYYTSVDYVRFEADFEKYFDDNMTAYIQEKVQNQVKPTYGENGLIDFNNLSFRITTLDGDLTKIGDSSYIDKPLFLMGSLLQTFFLDESNFDEDKAYTEETLKGFEKVVKDYEGTNLEKFVSELIPTLNEGKLTDESGDVFTKMFNMYSYSSEVIASGSFEYQVDKRMFIYEKLRLQTNLASAKKTGMVDSVQTIEYNLSELDRLFPEFKNLEVSNEEIIEETLNSRSSE